MPEQSDLVASLGKLSLSPAITDLSSDYEKARSKLIKYVKSIIKANEKYHNRDCEKYYIGKSTLHKKKEENFIEIIQKHGKQSLFVGDGMNTETKGSKP